MTGGVRAMRRGGEQGAEVTCDDGRFTGCDDGFLVHLTEGDGVILLCADHGAVRSVTVPA